MSLEACPCLSPPANLLGMFSLPFFLLSSKGIFFDSVTFGENLLLLHYKHQKKKNKKKNPTH